MQKVRRTLQQNVDRAKMGSHLPQGLRTKIEKIGEIEKLSLTCDFDQYPGKTLKKYPAFLNLR